MKKSLSTIANSGTFLLACFLLLFSTNLFALKIDRAIVASDSNPKYLDFWPLVAKGWQAMGIKPTLALIAGPEVIVDTTVGDVIRFQPIPGVSNALYSQAIRLLAPAYFPDDGCLVSDIDMFPLGRNYFLHSADEAPDNAFVIFRDKAYEPSMKAYPMCYVAAKGAVFQKLFEMENVEAIPQIIQKWSLFNIGWNTDEQMLYSYVQKWIGTRYPCVMLGHIVCDRLDRLDWENGMANLGKVHYIDAHMPRPYKDYKESIDKMAQAFFDSCKK